MSSATRSHLFKGTPYMKKLLFAILASLALTAPAFATTPLGYVQMSGTYLQDSTGTLITNATIYFAPVNSGGSPISYRVNGLGQVIDTAVSAQVTNGAFSLQLADTALTNP